MIYATITNGKTARKGNEPSTIPPMKGSCPLKDYTGERRETSSSGNLPKMTKQTGNRKDERAGITGRGGKSGNQTAAHGQQLEGLD